MLCATQQFIHGFGVDDAPASPRATALRFDDADEKDCVEDEDFADDDNNNESYLHNGNTAPFVPMKRTKLSVSQIKHALPHWLFLEVMGNNKPSSPKRQTLLRGIASLPLHLQAAFDDLRKERKHAMMTNNLVRQRETEKAMWDKLNGFMGQRPRLLDF